MDFLVDYGLWGLFASAFLAATILPLSSELVLSCLLLQDFAVSELVAVATLGNVLGSFVNYWLGFAGSGFVMTKILRISENDVEKAITRFKKHGAFCLIFAWVPVIGDPLTFAAGVLKINIVLFLILVTLGKLSRYLVLALFVQSF